ncbi:OmpP1/FadL family transporter [Schleiferia thermophila]|uniref:Outer membrane protein transport protein (OMPP1/FadL/TodX) n=1 Tax=Schleiferia thermophila TaxID=884107 RepID=A0A369ABF1_9FLAO|nr:hypothetical protein [Schleiferia thermophila]RCX05718.1 hypothetical protein DES35_1011006 [Schleiferia thermophila]GCD78794.1 transporter [Schleiferia thermophila]
MNIKKLTVFLLSLLASVLEIKAQNATDALRFSFLLPYGTARYNAMGGAFGALGNDIAGIHDNPAGVGVFRMDETIFSFGFLYSSIDANFQGITTPATQDRLLLGNLGIVRRVEDKKQAKHKASFALTFNRLANLDSEHFIEGVHPGSIGAVWFDRVQGLTEDQLFSQDPYIYYMAFFPFLIDYSDENTKVIDKLWGFGDQILHSHLRQTRGNISELGLTYGGNYLNRVQWGVQLGIPFINYSEQITYTESNFDPASILRFYQFRELLSLNGTGVNLKAGVIYRPEQNVRLSASVHTPSLNYIRGSFEVAPESRTFDNQIHRPNPLVDDNIRFQLTTPMRIQLGGAYIFDNLGLISAEYHLTDFSTNRLRSSLYNLSVDNQQIRDIYRISHQFRVGTEWRIERMALRTGFNHITSPFKNDAISGRFNGLHLGLGYRGQEFHADVSYSYFINHPEFFMYDADYITPAKLRNVRNTLMLTLIFRSI